MTKNYSTRAYRGYLTDLMRQCPHPDAGFFGPSSAVWRSMQEAVIILSFPRALVMQISEPAVAAGVAQHSDFPKKAVQRLYNSLVFNHTIAFRSCSSAVEALVQLYARHRKVQGQVEPGADYHANRADLQRWVLITTIDSISFALGNFFGSCPPVSPQDFYSESRQLFDLFRLDSKQLPRDVEDFHVQVGVELAEKTISATAREQFRAMLRLPNPVFWPSNRILLAGSLPHGLAQAYELPWDAPTQLSYRAGIQLMRAFNRFGPNWARIVPMARQSHRQLNFGGNL